MNYYTRWEIGGEPQPSVGSLSENRYYTRWEIGGEPQLDDAIYTAVEQLYPMGDRGGTATLAKHDVPHRYYTRWEIGGEPQHR